MRPKLRYSSNPLTPCLVSRNLLKSHSKNDSCLFQSVTSVSVFLIRLQHKNSTLTRSGQGSQYQLRSQNVICAIPSLSQENNPSLFTIVQDQSRKLHSPSTFYFLDRRRFRAPLHHVQERSLIMAKTILSNLVNLFQRYNRLAPVSQVSLTS